MKYQGFSQTLLLTPMNKAFETPTVTPHTGVWIETTGTHLITSDSIVTPVWILHIWGGSFSESG